MVNVFRLLAFKIWCARQFLKLWKSILYGDVSWYRCKTDGTEFLTAKESFEIAWVVYR